MLHNVHKVIPKQICSNIFKCIQAKVNTLYNSERDLKASKGLLKDSVYSVSMLKYAIHPSDWI